MDKKTIRITILTAIIILLLAAVVYFLFMYKFPGTTIPKIISKTATQATSTNNKIPVSATTTRPVAVKQTNIQPATSDVIMQANLKSIAESFSERLGSYSNQSNFSNISELKLYMTTSMQAWANQYIATNKKTAYSGIYQGMTTNAISAEINNFDSTKGAADILVHTQRVSVTGTSSPATAYQDIVITFVKQGSNWLVDNAMWKK